MKQKRKLLYRQGFTDQNRPFRDQDQLGPIGPRTYYRLWNHLIW